jgi:hypothetical protein
MRFYDLDIDVKNYAKRIVDAGYKCPADINSVSDFVKGLKILNLWGNIIDCWLMRSLQNAGSGTSLHALKYNINNGTMVNGPVWSDTGIVKNGATQYITIPRNILGGNISRTIIAVAKRSTAQNVVLSYGNLSATRFALKTEIGGDRVSLDAYNGSTNDNFGITNANGIFNQIAASYDGSTLIFKMNNAAATTSTISMSFSSNASNVIFGGWQTSNITSGLSTTPFGLISDTAFTSNEIDLFYNLYKSTLGKGLNLP